MGLDDRRLVRISKYLSKHLRHNPQRLGLTLEAGGWVPVTDLLDACHRSNFPITRAELDEVVERNDKRRFSFDDTGTKLRANQGHSVPIDLLLAPAVPPPTLFHGTARPAVATIMREGLRRMTRHHVHLSMTTDAALKVGARHGKPVVLAVDAQGMSSEGFTFYETKNGAWLTAEVPPRFLSEA